MCEIASVAGLTEPDSGCRGCGCGSSSAGGLFRGLPLRGLGTSLSAVLSLVGSDVELTASGFRKGRGVGRRNVTGDDSMGALDCREEHDWEASDKREDEADDRVEKAENTEEPEADEIEVATEVWWELGALVLGVSSEVGGRLSSSLSALKTLNNDERRRPVLGCRSSRRYSSRNRHARSSTDARDARARFLVSSMLSWMRPRATSSSIRAEGGGPAGRVVRGSTSSSSSLRK